MKTVLAKYRILFSFLAFFLIFQNLSAQQKENFFWDSVKNISEKDSFFPVSLYKDGKSYIFYERADKAKQTISISWLWKDGNLNWSDTYSLNETFKYSGTEVPDLYSAAVSNQNTIAVSVLDSSTANGIVKVYSKDSGSSEFECYSFPPLQKQITSSRIFATCSGGFLLFVSVGEGKQTLTESTFSIMYAESSDGKNWSELSKFAPSESISNTFSPFLAQAGERDLVVFEGWYEKDPASSQLYSTFRSPENNSWSNPVILTDSDSVIDIGKVFTETDMQLPDFLRYKNFRPMVFADGGDIKITWERTVKNSSVSTVMVAPLNYEGKILDKADVESLNSYGNARRPSLFKYHGKFFLLWFDDRTSVDKVHLCEYLGAQWVEVDSIERRQNVSAVSTYASPVISVSPQNTDTLSIIWQQQTEHSSQIVILNEDYFSQKPDFSARNFNKGHHNSEKNPVVKVILDEDISGVAGFSALWTFDENENPAKSEYSENFHFPKDNVLTAKIPDDTEGDKKLYFKACTLDKAGNWSDYQVLEYYYDQTPPMAVTGVSFDKDEWGFASSNDVSFTWKNDEFDDDEIAGYSWTLTRLGPIDKSLEVSKTKKIKFTQEETSQILENLAVKNELNFSKAKKPSSKINGKNSSASFKNRDNGVYLFLVCAVDAVGNVSPVNSTVLFLNKYKAATSIGNVTAQADDFGVVSLSISGQEFSYDGKISEVILTNNDTGKIYRFSNSNAGFSIKRLSDEKEEISDIKIPGMSKGSYTVQIRHSERGLSTWKKNLVIGENGTVKYEKNYNFEPVWQILSLTNDIYRLSSDKIAFWLIIAFIAAGILVCTRGLIVSAKDAFTIKKEMKLIMQGVYMDDEKPEELNKNAKVKVSLKIKFALAIVSLLLFIVAGISFIIGTEMMRIQEQIMISGLKERVKVVMGNMASGVQTYLDDGRERIAEIGAIVNQTDNFSESRYATIISYQIDGIPVQNKDDADYGRKPLDYVWATNDEDILSKIDSDTFDAGSVRIKVAHADFFRSFILKTNIDAKAIASELSHTTGDNSNLIFRKLNDFSASVYGSFPAMNDNRLDRQQTNYLFYWPVLYQKTNDDNLIQAVILMKVETKTLVKQIDDSQQIVLFISGVAALLAAVIALVSAFILSSVITRPIMKIVSHVKKITETENKLLLEGVEIKIKSHDELRTLGDSVNDMTKGLVQGAKNEARAKIAYQRAAKDREEAARARAESAEMNIMNLDGQAVQKAFIPLVSDGAEKETTASYKDKELELFGYYEGTDAVSGDYFDYKKLDERWYAFIKCDASGHGVPAALIMTIVATIFRRYFASWKFEKNGVQLNLLASDINDFIESLGLRGKFAAMMICLFDTKNGDVYTCNAGDNILRIYDSNEKKIKVLTLHEAPAAGPLPSFMVEMKGGYKVEKIKLKPNDILFLYTDGIEESTRFFRNSDFEIIPCSEAGLNDGEVHETHKKGEKSEQMEPKRVQDVIEAVLNRKKYILKRYHTPVSDEKLEFDLSRIVA
ncbi:SpoIIE family protein phosphatase, partial [Treponema sp.]|uniref:SpoIIE family protein phosphatase n=1 Tax=Treponema sp. TaxID=166 RepID=UPI00388EB256